MQNLQQHLSEFPIYQLQDRIAFAALKTNATAINQEKVRNIIHNQKNYISIYLWYDCEILNSPHPNKKPSLTIELVQNIVYAQRCLYKTPSWHGEKERNNQGRKRKLTKKHQVIFTHDPGEQPAKIINVR